MQDKDIFVVAEQWYESRTPNGRWSKTKKDYRIELFNRKQFDTFLAAFWSGERRSGYTYTMYGYFPTRIVVPSPNATRRSVTEFTFSDEPRFTDLLRDFFESDDT